MYDIRTAALLLVAVVCLCAIYAAPLEDSVAQQPLAEENYRLPDTITPVNYKIHLKPYLLESDADKRFTFDGEVEIEFKSTQATNKIQLHSRALNYSLSECYLKTNPNAKIILTNETNAITNIVTFTTGTAIIAGSSYILHFKFVGSLGDDMYGFYRSYYVDSNNVTKWLASTQFQSYHARRAFPSFDEPKFKATFDISITRHRSMKSVSNTKIINSVLNGEYYTDVYSTTPLMSTYIIAFLVSDFNERSNEKFSILARPEYYDQTEYGYVVGQKLLADLDSYLNKPYYDMGIDKMHMAAIPDFSAGAMENWGLITYRERLLLVKEDSTTLSAKQAIAATITHEQAHLWFGDLVTCDWWSYTWLNEGFARFFQYFGTHSVEKHYQMDVQFPVDQIQSVMAMDSTNNTNPMSDENTNSPADLSRMFNSISYNKGATIIRMLKHVMGEGNFQKSLQEYLKENALKTVVPKNLLDAFKLNWPTNSSDHADDIFNSFTTQVGYPVIYTELSDDGKSVGFSQKRFLLRPNDGSNASLLYTVPISYTTSTNPDFENTAPQVFLPASTNKLTVTLPNEAKWVVANIQETGYYRVNYTENLWHEIHHALNADNWSNIHELNRAQIVDDLLNLARASELTYELALNVLEYLEKETKYLPWKSAFNGFSFLSMRLGTEMDHFRIYIKELTNKAYHQLGFEEKTNESTLDIYNRAQVLSWSCRYRNADCITKAQNYFNNIKTTPVPVNIRSAVYCVAMREGKNSDFDILYQKYITETVATEQSLILSALGCVKDNDLITRFFNMILTKDVRLQDKSAALTSLYTENNENVSPVFKLVTDKYEELADAMGSYSAVASVISNIASRFTESKQQEELATFNRNHGSKFGSSVQTLTNAEATVTENLEWSQNKLGVFKNYLALRSGSATTNAFTGFTIVLVAVIAMLFR